MKNKILLVGLIFLLLACFSKKYNNLNNEKIEITYLKGFVQSERAVPIEFYREERIQKLEFDTVLIDKTKFRQIINDLKLIKISKKPPKTYDFRMVIVFKNAIYGINDLSEFIKDKQKYEIKDSLLYSLRYYSHYYDYSAEQFVECEKIKNFDKNFDIKYGNSKNKNSRLMSPNDEFRFKRICIMSK